MIHNSSCMGYADSCKLRAIFRQAFKEYKLIPLIPELSKSKLDFIIANTPPNGTILEYGCGASTIFLAKLGFKLFSIESSRSWARSVQNEASLNNLDITIVHKNIGPTISYGFPYPKMQPIFKYIYPRYINLEFVKERIIDSVVVDGRFRVACVANCLKNLNPKPRIILIDDFYSRSEYGVLEKFTSFYSRIEDSAIIFPQDLELENSHEINSIIDNFIFNPS
jgi:hypothetical protein